LTEGTDSQFVLDVKLPAVARFDSMPPLFPAKCRVEGAPVMERHQAVNEMRIGFHCATPLTAGDVLLLPWPYQGAFVSAESRVGAPVGHYFQASTQGVEIPLGILRSSSAETRLGVAKRYLELGVEHILTGWDHLAFVLTLCLIASGLRLLKLVSAFTVGHSMTLALATLGVVHVPIPPTEACIALSIAFMARAAVRRGTVPHGAGLVFGFGLLHGLGFATALAESGIDRSEFFVGLVTFNLGVECGQLMFVAVVFAVAFLGRYLTLDLRQQLATATGYGLGVLGAFWTLQRTL